MLRLIFILIAITALSLGAAWIADEPGHVAIDWGAYHIETSLLVLLAGIGIASLWCIIVYYVLFAILRTPRSWLRSRLARRQALGLEALTGAFAGIATQDLRSARKQIARAQHYLPHQPLTLMLASQVARLEGNDSKSRLYLEQMLKAEPTEFMALRGLIENARRSHDDDTAILHAEKALVLKASDPWLTRALVGLYAKNNRADDALRLLGRARGRRALSRREAADLSAMVLYNSARALVREQRFDLAIPALKDVLRLKAGFIPASALLASAYSKEGNVRASLKVIAGAWKKTPHPLLTHALLASFELPKSQDKVTRLADALARMHPNHKESRFLLAAIALKNGDAEIARNELHYLLTGHESARACGMMAQALQASGDSVAAGDWMKRSHSAPADPGFVCDNCRQSSPEWQLTCPQCGTVGAIEWKSH